jgi:glycosyltransferase involved in cell wall biosynthesis
MARVVASTGTPSPAQQPLVSVIATCFNHERYLVECLDSIRAQTYPRTELIIVDDCSADGSVALIQEWLRTTGTECSLIVHEENQGVCRTRNHALAQARGKYVSSISTDDVWLPDKIAVQVAQMEKLPSSVGVLYGDAYLIDEAGNPLPKTFFESSRHTRTFEQPPEGDVFAQLLEVIFVPVMTTLVRRDCYETVGPYDESLAYEDRDMLLRLARRYDFAYTPHVGARYRIHSSSLSQTIGDRAGESDLRTYRKHVGHRPALDPVLWDLIARLAYRLDRPEQLEYARANLRTAPSLKALLLYVLCRTGIPYRRVAPLKRTLSRLRSAARPRG